MGSSTNGQLCFGFPLKAEDGDLPWSSRRDGIEGWWRELNG